MARDTAKKIKQQIKIQDDDVYGDTSASGSMPDPESDDDVKEMVKDIIGEAPVSGDPFEIAEEVDEDEEALRSKSDKGNLEESEEE